MKHAADASNKEQMPLIIQHVDKQCYVREGFFEFVLCDTGTTGHALAESSRTRSLSLG